MKSVKSLCLLSTLSLIGCASTPNISEMKSVSKDDAEKVYTAARKGDSKFLFDEFSDSYKGNNKIKKIAILYYSIGWDPSEDLRGEKGQQTPTSAYKEHEKVVYDSMNEMIATFKKLGYEVITPEALAQESATFKALQAQVGVNHYSPNHGEHLQGISVKDSRYIHMMTHEGKLLSKINDEAPSVDAFIGFNMNVIGKSGTKWLLDDTKFFGVNSSHAAHSFLCVSRKKAEANKVKLGWFGDANDCARAQALFKASIYTSDTESKGKSHYDEINELGYSNMSLMYRNVARGLVENYYDEGLKD